MCAAAACNLPTFAGRNEPDARTWMDCAWPSLTAGVPQLHVRSLGTLASRRPSRAVPTMIAESGRVMLRISCYNSRSWVAQIVKLKMECAMLQMLMSVSNKKATVSPPPAIRRDDNPSRHPPICRVSCPISLSRVQTAKCPHACRPEDDSSLRRSKLAITRVLVRPIVWESIPERSVDAGCEVAVEIIWSNLRQFNHAPSFRGERWHLGNGCRWRTLLRSTPPTKHLRWVKSCGDDH
jgi:hypothetical protein